MAKVGIFGSGTVGLANGAGFKELGNDVLFYDIDRSRVRNLLNKGFNATSDLSQVVLRSDFSFVCVPTPNIDGSIDLTAVRKVVTGIANSLLGKHAYHVLVIKSTVVPTSTEKVIAPILENILGRELETRIGVCVNPEFMTEIHSSWTRNASFARTWFNQERIVIGELNERSGDALQALYEPLGVPAIRTNLRTAEMIKYASNCALASRISYWNEIYYICQRLRINSRTVAEVVGKDKRIGEYGTVHGKAFGGKCLPKDLQAFISFSQQIGYEPILMKAVSEINKRIEADKGIRR